MQPSFSFNHLPHFLFSSGNLSVADSPSFHFSCLCLYLCRLAILHVSVCLSDSRLCWILSSSEDSHPLSLSLSHGREKREGEKLKVRREGGRAGEEKMKCVSK